MANRTQQRAERVLGPLENTALIRTQMDLDLSFREAFSRVRDAVLDAYARQELPFDVLAARLKRESGIDPASLLQVFFVLQNPLDSRSSFTMSPCALSETSTGKVSRHCRSTAPGSL